MTIHIRIIEDAHTLITERPWEQDISHGEPIIMMEI
jgi:hypothetical protein